MFKHVFAAGLLLAAAAPLPVFAQTIVLPVQASVGPHGDIVEISGGCGPYGHRGPFGACRPNFYHHRACPLGFHLGPYGRRCFPND